MSSLMIIIILIAILIWIITLSKADFIGKTFTKLIIDPIKSLFE